MLTIISFGSSDLLDQVHLQTRIIHSILQDKVSVHFSKVLRLLSQSRTEIRFLFEAKFDPLVDSWCEVAPVRFVSPRSMFVKVKLIRLDSAVRTNLLRTAWSVSVQMIFVWWLETHTANHLCNYVCLCPVPLFLSDTSVRSHSLVIQSRWARWFGPFARWVSWSTQQRYASRRRLHCF